MYIPVVGVQTCGAEPYIPGCSVESLTAAHPAAKHADCASCLMLRFSAAFDGGIHGGLLTGDVTGRCHLCKPGLKKHEIHEIGIALSVCSD